MGTILWMAGQVGAGQWDPVLSTASIDPAITSTVSVFTVPNGSGHRLLEAMIEPGVMVDATITATFIDAGGNPMFLYPGQDIWIETSSGGLAACMAGTISDGDTDINGQTTFSGTFRAGGYSNRTGGEKARVIINGTALIGSDLDILFNSPDLDGDGQVGLSDTVIFVPRYTGGAYDYSVDYFFDGQINLSDLVLYAGGLNSACP